jgi:hypothetical protein
MNYRLSFHAPWSIFRQVHLFGNASSAESAMYTYKKQGASDFVLEELVWNDVTPSAWKEQDATKS